MAIYKRTYYTNDWGETFRFNVYEYRGHEYEVEENLSKGGSEPLAWQHRNEQARIDRIIKMDEMPEAANDPDWASVDEVMNELFECWER